MYRIYVKVILNVQFIDLSLALLPRYYRTTIEKYGINNKGSCTTFWRSFFQFHIKNNKQFLCSAFQIRLHYINELLIKPYSALYIRYVIFDQPLQESSKWYSDMSLKLKRIFNFITPHLHLALVPAEGITGHSGGCLRLQRGRLHPTYFCHPVIL